MNPTNETATSIRCRQASMERTKRRLQDRPEQQAEAIARHYVAHHQIALTMLQLIQGPRLSNKQPSAEVDWVIKMFAETIQNNHADDFGIALEWPVKEHP